MHEIYIFSQFIIKSDFVLLFKVHAIPRWRNCIIECTFPLLCSELLNFWCFVFIQQYTLNIELRGDNCNFRKRISVSLKKTNGMFVDNLKNLVALKVGALYNNKRESSLVPDIFSIKCTSAHIPFEVPFFSFVQRNHWEIADSGAICTLPEKLSMIASSFWTL